MSTIYFSAIENISDQIQISRDKLVEGVTSPAEHMKHSQYRRVRERSDVTHNYRKACTLHRVPQNNGYRDAQHVGHCQELSAITNMERLLLSKDL